MKILFSIAVVAVMLFSVDASMAQGRVSIAGGASMVAKDNASWALEVNGKVVTGYGYKHFQSTDGVYFAVEDKNGKWGVCDNTGAFIHNCQFAKTYVNDATAMLYDTANGTPKIYDCKTRQYVQAQQADADFFDKGRDFNPEKMTRDKAIAESKRLSSLVTPDGRFEIRMKANSQRQELVAQGKVILEAQEFTEILTDEANWNETGCWVFIVKNGGLYGTFCLGTWEEDGKLNLETVWFIPCEYTFMRSDPDRPGIVRCTTKSGVVKLKGYAGKDVQ